jgi:hypothetical protein
MTPPPKLSCDRVMLAISRVTSIPLPDVIPTPIWASAEALRLRSPTGNIMRRALVRTDFIFAMAHAAVRLTLSSYDPGTGSHTASGPRGS